MAGGAGRHPGTTESTGACCPLRGQQLLDGASGAEPQRLIGGLRPGRQGVGNLGHLFVVPRGGMPGGLNTPPPSTDPSSQMVLMTSGLGTACWLRLRCDSPFLRIITFVSPALCPRCQGQTLGLGDEGWWCLGLWQLLAVWWELWRL